MPSEVNSQTVRAGVYARYSSDSQREASINDQIRICRDEIERHGWDLIQVYADGAISAASTLHPGDQKLLQDASAGAIDVVVAENLDRSSHVTKRMSPPVQHLNPQQRAIVVRIFQRLRPGGVASGDCVTCHCDGRYPILESSGDALSVDLEALNDPVGRRMYLLTLVPV